MKRLLSRQIFIFLISIFVFKETWAVIDIKITQGVDSAQPIIINDFITSAEVRDEMSPVIRKDLQFGGDFKVISPSFTLNKNKLDSKTIDYLYNSGADGYVTGKISKLPDSRYQVSIKLYKLYTSKNSASHHVVRKQIKADLSKSFKVSSRQMHKLAHHLSDLIFAKLIGEKGYFSTKIAYVRISHSDPQEYALEVADYDGENAKAVLISKEPILSPAWSPNGEKLAYVSFEGKHSAVYISEIRTGTRQLVSRSKGMNSAPAWSPDGKKLALVLSSDGGAKIFIKDLMSGVIKRLTQGYYSIDTEPKWSADGAYLLFTSNRGGYPQIYQYSFVTHGVKRITYEGRYNVRAVYSPDNTYIALNHALGNYFYIAVMDLSSKKLQIISTGNADESPSIAPNGREILFSKLKEGKRILMFVNRSGNYHRTVLSSKYELQEPVWSPFYS